MHSTEPKSLGHLTGGITFDPGARWGPFFFFKSPEIEFSTSWQGSPRENWIFLGPEDFILDPKFHMQSYFPIFESGNFLIVFNKSISSVMLF